MSDETKPTGTVQVFFSYAHEDEKLKEELQKHLSNIERQGIIVSWNDRDITPGREWAGDINEHINTAGLILLLISPDFMSSGYCNDIELERAMERHEAGEARVIPISLRPVDWEGAAFEKLQALPTDARPVTSRRNRDTALLEVARGIRKAVEEIASQSGDKSSWKRNEPIIPRPPVVGFVARRDLEGRDIVKYLAEELAPEKNQLIALWGPGGTGKTTLAAEVVRATAGVFKGRVAWVSALGRAEFNLASLLDEIATQLGHANLRTLAPEPKAAQVAALVGMHPTLVVLDNFETITEEAQKRCLDFLARSAACPALITTRYRINRDDVSNAPLAAMSVEEARDFLQRLAERARTPSNFDRLDRDDLIQRCEANPLVLQWVVRQIDLAKRPQDVLNDLAQGEGDAAERVFTRSFNLPQVGEDGRAVLLALSLFTPSASRDALAEVSGFDDDLRRLNNAVENLSALWLVETTEGNERLFLRGLTRELSKSLLSKDARADEFRRRYVAYFLQHAAGHRKPVPKDLDALEAEKDNLLGAMDAAFGMQDWDGVMRICGMLEHFLDLRGYWDEAVRSGELAEAAAAREAKNDFNVATFRVHVAKIRLFRGEYEEAGRVYRDALEIFRSVGDENNVAICLHYLGIVAQEQNDFEEALRLYDESLEIERKLGDQSLIAHTTSQIGIVLNHQGKIDESKVKHEESLALRRRLDEKEGIALDLNQLAIIARKQGDSEEARRLFNESLEIEIKLGNQNGIARTSCNLGLLAEEEGDKTEAARLFRKALHIYEKLGAAEVEKVRRILARAEGESD